MKLSFSIAKRFLRASLGQTLLIMVGIAIGVSVQIFIGLLITGLQNGLIDKTVGSSAHITLKAADETPFEPSAVKVPLNDAYSLVAKLADGPVILSTSEKSESALLRGSDPGAQELYGYPDKLVEGRLPKNSGEILVGTLLADKLGLKVGDKATLRTFANFTREVRVSGIYDLKVAAINGSWLVSDLKLSQDLFGYDNKLTGIEIQVKDVFAADTLASELAAKQSSAFTVLNWKDQNAELLSGLNGQSISSLMIQIFVLVSVVLGIASVLAITVLQKSRQIGILKAMGIDDAKASLIFLFQGLLLGTGGALLGIAFGLGLIAMFTTFARNPDGSALIAISYDLPFILFSGAIAVFSALAASLIPAARSRKLSPIEVIRNG